MPLQELIDKNLVTCSPDAPIKQVAILMKDRNVGCVLVTEDGFPSGIVTDRDLVIRCVCEGVECDQVPVRDVMTHSVETVSLTEGINDVIRCMKGEEIRRVVVVDDAGRAIGLLSFGDMVNLLARELNDLTTATSDAKAEDLAKAAA